MKVVKPPTENNNKGENSKPRTFTEEKKIEKKLGIVLNIKSLKKLSN